MKKRRKLAEDEADFIISERRLKEDQEGIPLDEYLRERGYEMVRVLGRWVARKVPKKTETS